MAVFSLFLFLLLLFVLLVYFAVGYNIAPGPERIPGLAIGALAALLLLYAFYSLAYDINEWINLVLVW